jgi:hypothetical protein
MRPSHSQGEVICNLSLSILVATHPSIFLLVAVSLRSQSGFRGSGMFRRYSPMYLIASMRSMVCSWFAPLSSILVATHLLSFFWLPRRAIDNLALAGSRGGLLRRCIPMYLCPWMEAPPGVAAIVLRHRQVLPPVASRWVGRLGCVFLCNILPA